MKYCNSTASVEVKSSLVTALLLDFAQFLYTVNVAPDAKNSAFQKKFEDL
jgi:hypothetical protein